MDVTFIVAVSLFLFFISLILVSAINYFTRTPESATILELRDKTKELFDTFFGSRGIATAERATTNLYRVPLLLEETNGTDRTNEVVAFDIEFDYDCNKKTSWNNSVRVYDQQFTEIPSRISYQEFCSSQWLNSSLVTFLTNISANEKKRVYVYWLNNTGTTAPDHDLSLAGYWTLDEAGGTLAKDFSGNENNGTLTNFDFNASSGWFNGTDCKYGSCLKFDGVNDWVSAVGASLNMGTSNFSVSAWFKPAVAAFSGAIAQKYASDGGYSLGFRNGLFDFCYGGSCDLNNGNFQGYVNQWTHLGFMFDTLTNTGDLYINGKYALTVSVSPTQNGTSVASLKIGYDSWIRGRYFNGTIDDVRIYNKTLTTAEIASLANATLLTTKTFPDETITAIDASKVQELTGRNYEEIKAILGGDFGFRIEIREK